MRFATARDGARIAYLTRGSGRPLVVVGRPWAAEIAPSLGVERYATLMERLSAGRSVVSMDFRGAGYSELTTDVSIDGYGSDLDAVADACGGRVDLMAYGPGGVLALDAAGRRPEAVRRVVLLNCAGRWPPPTGRRALETMTSALAVDRELGARVTAQMLAGWESPADARAFLEQPAARSIPRAVRRAVWRVRRQPFAPALAAVQAPVLALFREAVELPSLEGVQELVRALPSAELRILSGDAWLIWAGDQEELCSAVTTFLDEEERGRASEREMHEEMPLTPRQLEVLRLVATGSSSKEIASELGISANTVLRHLNEVYRRLGVSGRVEAAVWAAERGVTRE